MATQNNSVTKLIEARQKQLEAENKGFAQEIVEANDTIVDVLDKNDLLEDFIQGALKSEGLQDHYRDTQVGGKNGQTTGQQIDNYVSSSGAHLNYDDSRAHTDKEKAEGYSKDAMLEAHGKAEWKKEKPKGMSEDKVSLESDLYDFRREQADYAIQVKDFRKQSSGMTPEEARNAGVLEPQKPELSEEWKDKIAGMAVNHAMAPTTDKVEENGKQVTVRNPLAQWPATQVPDAKDREAVLGNPRKDVKGAMETRKDAMDGIAANTAERQQLEGGLAKMYEQQVGPQLGSLEQHATALSAQSPQSPQPGGAHELQGPEDGGIRTVRGELLESNTAPRNFDVGGRNSQYANIKVGNEEQTVWSDTLQDDLARSGAKPRDMQSGQSGSQIEVQVRGDEALSVNLAREQQQGSQKQAAPSAQQTLKEAEPVKAAEGAIEWEATPSLRERLPAQEAAEKASAKKSGISDEKMAQIEQWGKEGKTAFTEVNQDFGITPEKNDEFLRGRNGALYERGLGEVRSLQKSAASRDPVEQASRADKWKSSEQGFAKALEEINMGSKLQKQRERSTEIGQ